MKFDLRQNCFYKFYNSVHYKIIKYRISKKREYFKTFYNLNCKNELRDLFGIHDNQRCFIIGNGPSLCAQDLDLLKDEITFSCNKIYKIFSETVWRPYYYIVDDINIANDDVQNIINVRSKKTFVGIETDVNVLKKYLNTNVTLFRKVTTILDGLPQISNDLCKYLGSGYTVLFPAFQLAVLMGFKEIYFLGVDCSYQTNNNTSNWFYGNEKTSVQKSVADEMQRAFKSIYEYATANNINVYNATRGGMLEIFERVNLNDLMKGCKDI